MQILDNYYEPGTPSPSFEHKDGSPNLSFTLQLNQPELLTAKPTVDSNQQQDPNSLPVHFYLQNLHYQRLQQTIHTATKDKRKQKQQQ
ncbi:hypothetical protein [Oceanicoccus sagamiensis]|uniref:Uncharacterized protein n=1 Tax=Oceanicoccus sagamiensis TaxID=716816 RepID=A0A1X9NA82_9GAMM|nr:hypothetical protein [Oceanicoccus sagamiensis]ARN74536.1 hypothetical protein BST96_10630 [Oceanicoccus sagamiensis]